MYLTRLSLDPRSAQARRDLSDAYEMHRTLARAFVTDEHSQPYRFLWRLEAAGNAWANPVVLVQSEIAANWGGLQSMPNYLARHVEIKEFDPVDSTAEGARVRFRLLANPTVTRAGKRLGLTREDEQLAWLARKGERHGFVIDCALVSASDFSSSRKDGTQVSVQRACFEGILRVRKQDLLMKAMALGIGPAKAFGCGLLSLART